MSDTCYRSIGEGCIQLDAIMKAAQDCPIIENGIIIDQDDANIDFFEESRRGVSYVKTYCKRQKANDDRKGRDQSGA